MGSSSLLVEAAVYSDMGIEDGEIVCGHQGPVFIKALGIEKCKDTIIGGASVPLLAA